MLYHTVLVCVCSVVVLFIVLHRYRCSQTPFDCRCLVLLETDAELICGFHLCRGKCIDLARDTCDPMWRRRQLGGNRILCILGIHLPLRLRNDSSFHDALHTYIIHEIFSGPRLWGVMNLTTVSQSYVLRSSSHLSVSPRENSQMLL
jgi:hypothetical protein